MDCRELYTQRKNTSEVQHWERVYRKWIDRQRNLNGRAPQPQQVGDKIRDTRKEAKQKLSSKKKRRQQELSTKEFYKKYKIPHGVQWIAEMDITPDWNQPDVKTEQRRRPQIFSVKPHSTITGSSLRSSQTKVPQTPCWPH